MLRGFAKTLPDATHASDNLAGLLIIALAAKTDQSLDTIAIGLQRFSGVALFACFGELLEKSFTAAMLLDDHPSVRQQSFRHR